MPRPEQGMGGLEGAVNLSPAPGGGGAKRCSTGIKTRVEGTVLCCQKDRGIAYGLGSSTFLDQNPPDYLTKVLHAECMWALATNIRVHSRKLETLWSGVDQHTRTTCAEKRMKL